MTWAQIAAFSVPVAVGAVAWRDIDASALGFYRKLGFTLLEGDKSPAPSPMFVPLSAIA